MNIPQTLRQIRAGELRKAMATIKQEIALPAILGRLCHRPCEAGCRRSMHDEGVSICMLVRHAADQDLASGDPYQPSRGRPKNKRVAIIGAGPAGLSAAYYLLLDGYACTIFDRNPEPGGSLLAEVDKGELSREVLDAELRSIRDLGAQFQHGCEIDQEAFGKLREEFDATLVAPGLIEEDATDWLGLEVGRAGIAADRDTLETPEKGVFAAGHAIRRTGKIVHAIADGKSAATSIRQYLADFHVLGPPRPFSCQVGRLKENEMDEFLVDVNTGGKTTPARGEEAGFDFEEALREAERCVHCDCHAADTCKLRELAQRYGATQNRYGVERPRFERRTEHPFVIFEPGKCIRCGNCIRVAEAAKESLGLTFVGRGFDVKLGVPFNGTLSDGLQKVAEEAVAACPVGALVLKETPTSRTS